MFAKGNLLLHYISNLPLGVTNEGREAIKPISGAVVGDSKVQQKTGLVNRTIFVAVAGDSSLQDRVVAH